MAWVQWENVSGGRVHMDENGDQWFYLRRSVGGVRREFPLGSDERAALAEVALFEASPETYKPRKERAAAALRQSDGASVRLDLETLEAFGDWCKEQQKAGQLSEGYVKHTLGPYLAAWAKALGDRPLQKVTLDDLQALLKKKEWKTARHKRIVALKAFASWAREVKDAPKLLRTQDPTIELKTPPVIPEKKRRKKGYEIVFVEKLYAALSSQLARDTIRLRACAHGMHDTEIARLARGEGELTRVSDPGGIEGVIVFRHEKKREDHAISVDAASFAAAERLQARGVGLSRSAMRTMLQRVAIRWCGCGGITKSRLNKRGEKVWETFPCPKCISIRPSELRHSFATWGQTVGKAVYAKGQKGVPLEAVQVAMGHLNKKTTAGFYVGDRVPMMIKIPIRLEHPEDPPVAKPKGKKAA